LQHRIVFFAQRNTLVQARQQLLFQREAKEEKDQHYKRATARYTAMSRFSGSSYSRSNSRGNSDIESRNGEFLDFTGPNDEETEAVEFFESQIGILRRLKISKKTKYYNFQIVYLKKIFFNQIITKKLF